MQRPEAGSAGKPWSPRAGEAADSFVQEEGLSEMGDFQFQTGTPEEVRTRRTRCVELEAQEEEME